MQQVMIYEYLGTEEDPVFTKISDLDRGKSIELEDMELSLNSFGLYEVSNEFFHEGFNDIMSCYKFICQELRNRLSNQDE
ncbi:hypothetical protein [Oceanobacillus sp. FSL W7-1309]|uniref:hypothetical protein n=1 Tax=Oceanobacillus sp. FSL W7-1309 TaxID=2954539 RepID=UPI0030F523F6